MSHSANPPPFRRLPLSVSDLLLVLILGLGAARLVVPAVAGLSGLRDTGTESRIALVLLLLAVQTGLLMLAVHVVVVRWRGVGWNELGFVPVARRWTGTAVALAILCMPLMGVVAWVQQQITGQEFHNPQLEIMAPPAFSWPAYLGTLLVAGVLVPIVEEVVFRGLLYRWLRERLGMAVGLVLSALAFSVLHGVAGLIPPIALLGAVLAWVYERAGSLWAPIVLHGTYNTVVTTLLYIALAQGIKPPGM